MILYHVKSGDSIFRIARTFGVSAVKLMEDNRILTPEHLAEGDCILISQPTQIYTVGGGDTLARIAARFGVSLGSLLRNNPSLVGKTKLYPGQNLSIRLQSPRGGTLLTHAYATGGESDDELCSLLPYLSNLCYLGAFISPERGLTIPQRAERIRSLCKEYGVHEFIRLPYDALVPLTAETLSVIVRDGWHGLEVSVPPSGDVDSAAIKRLREDLRSFNRALFLHVNAGFENAPAVIAELTKYADAVVWETPPSPSISLEEECLLLERISEACDSDKIIPLLTACGVDTAAERVTRIPLSKVAMLAAQKNAAISYDVDLATSGFYYKIHHGGKSIEHHVECMLTDGFSSRIHRMDAFGFRGIGITEALPFYAPLWLMLQSDFRILKGVFGRLC